MFFLCRIRIDWTCKFFCDVVWCIFDSIKIDFYRVKGYFSGESCHTKKKGETYLKSLQKELIWVNPGQCKNKNDYDHSFKTRLRSQFRARPGSYIRLIIDTSQCMDKNSYYYIFKTLLGGRLEAKPESWVGLVIDPSQNKKNCYYHNFKIRLGDQPGTRLGSSVRLTVDSSQRKDKNIYYHNFKI